MEWNKVAGIKHAMEEIKGSFSLLLLTPEGIYAACDPSYHWPLIVGSKQGAIAIGSERAGFRNFNFHLKRQIEPGEVARVKNGVLKSKTKPKGPPKRICSFSWVYTTFPNAEMEGVVASEVRKKLGASLARRDIERGFVPDIVTPVPDSGRFHAIGYKEEFNRQSNQGKIDQAPFYDEVLLKYYYAGRSFTAQQQSERDKKAHLKLLPSGENYQGKTVAVCDDSIVRGTQMKTNLVPKLKAVNFKEVHARISNPELVSHCQWGKTTKEGETLVSRIPELEERRKELGLDSLRYNEIDDLVQAIGLPKKELCFDCAKAK